MKPSPRAPFDWHALRRTIRFQPVIVWIVCAFFLKPAAQATPWLLRASCSGPVRDGVANLAFIAYVLVVPPAAAALVYLFAGRRRMSGQIRLMGDCGLTLILLISAANAYSLAGQARARWSTMSPGLSALRAACWK